jgi:hypothetical protein
MVGNRRTPRFNPQVAPQHFLSGGIVPKHRAALSLGARALRGAVVLGAEMTIVKYSIDHGARVDAETRLGWTSLMLGGGVFASNTKKEFPEIAAGSTKTRVQLAQHPYHPQTKRKLVPPQPISPPDGHR